MLEALMKEDMYLVFGRIDAHDSQPARRPGHPGQRPAPNVARSSHTHGGRSALTRVLGFKC